MDILKCQKCEKDFTLQKNLNQHERTVHANIKKHVCGICQKRFSRKNHKEMHLRVCSKRVMGSAAEKVDNSEKKVDDGSLLKSENNSKKKKCAVGGGGFTRETFEKWENVAKRKSKLKFTPMNVNYFECLVRSRLK